MMKKDELINTAREVLAVSPFKDTEISVSAGKKMLTRYGDNKITQNVESHSTSVSIRAAVSAGDKIKTARVESDQLDAESIQKTYDRLAKILEVMPASHGVAPMHGPGDSYSVPERKQIELP